MIKVNLLAVSVGNTRTRVGAFVDSRITESATFENAGGDGMLREAIECASRPLRDKDDSIVLMSSVNPKIERDIEAGIKRVLKCAVHHVERDMPIPIGRRLDPEAIVGEDRLLNAAAAYDVLRQSCVVADAGTAITIDFVDGAGTFHGGAIAPGGQLMLDAMSGRIEHLPGVELARPDEAIGHNTIEAMKAGVYYGLRGMLRELVERFAEQAGSFPMVVATGGDANLVFRDFDLVDRIVPDLTLMGLAVTMRVAMESAGGSRSDET